MVATKTPAHAPKRRETSQACAFRWEFHGGKTSVLGLGFQVLGSRVGRVKRVPPFSDEDGGTRFTRPTLRLLSPKTEDLLSVRRHIPDDIVRQGSDRPGVEAGEAAQLVRLHREHRHLARGAGLRVARLHLEVRFGVACQSAGQESAVAGQERHDPIAGFAGLKDVGGRELRFAGSYDDGKHLGQQLLSDLQAEPLVAPEQPRAANNWTLCRLRLVIEMLLIGSDGPLGCSALVG